MESTPGDAVDIDYAAVLRDARRFLARWSDRLTCNDRDDLAQEAVIEVWQRRALLRDPRSANAFVRTVARRLRARALDASRRRGVVGLDDVPPPIAGRAGEGDPAQAAGVHDALRVRECVVDRDWLLGALQRELCRLPGVQGGVLASFYAGVPAARIAQRYRLRRHTIKARLHRGRQQLRTAFEQRIETALRLRDRHVDHAAPPPAAHESVHARPGAGPTEETDRCSSDSRP